MSGEWQTVLRRKNGNKIMTQTLQQRMASDPFDSPSEDVNAPGGEERVLALRREIEDLLSSLRLHCSSFLHRIKENLPIREEETDLICLGIGRFSSSESAKLQFALAVHLRECLPALRTMVYDPGFGALEIAVCKQLEFEVLSENLYGKYGVQRKTVFFMPHCPYRLYCNVLWRNRLRLHDLVILGNSFLSYSLRRMSSDSEMDRTDLVAVLSSYVDESVVYLEEETHLRDKVPPCFDRAFNDLR